MTNRVIRSTLVFSIGEVINKIFPFFLIPFLSRVLGVESYGHYQVIFSVVVIISIILNFGMELAISRYYHFKGGRFVVSLLLIYYSVITCVLLILCLLLNDEIISIVVFCALFQGVLNSILSLYIASGAAKKYIFVQFAQASCNFFFTYIILTYLRAEVYYCFYALLGANLIASIFGGYILIKDEVNKVRISHKYIKPIFLYVSSFGFSVIVHQLAQASKGHIDKFFLFPMVDSKVLSLYSVAFQFSIILQVLLMAINKALMPFFYKGIKSGNLNDRVIFKYSLIGFLVFPIVLFATSLIPSYMFVFILGVDFDGVKAFFVPIVCGIALNVPYMIIGNYFFAQKKNSIMALISLFSAFIYLSLIVATAKYEVSMLKYSLLVTNLITVLLMFSFLRLENEKNS